MPCNRSSRRLLPPLVGAACLLVGVGLAPPEDMFPLPGVGPRVGLAQGGGDAPVEFELLTEKNFAPTEARVWLAFFAGAGLENVRIRGALPSDEGRVVNRGTEAAPRYHVTGFLTADGKVRLPGATFSPRDKAGLAAWLAELRGDGIDRMFSDKGAFGLTAKELVTIHERLAVKLDFSTKGRPTNEVLKQVAALTRLPVESDPSARGAYRADAVALDELQGVSAGTALAALLRPLGLVFAPRKTSDRAAPLKLWVADHKSLPEAWPVGWPSQKPPGETLPKLFEFLTFEVTDFPAASALEAVRERLGAPLLYDHNSLARYGVELANVKVSLPRGRSYYRRILDQICGAAKVQAEVRVDEAGQAFLWISATPFGRP